MRVPALVFGLSVTATALLIWIATQGYILGEGALLGVLLVVSGMVWKTNASPRMVTIAGLSIITVDFLAYTARYFTQFGREFALQNNWQGLILLGILALLMRVVWKSDSKWVSLLTVLLGLLIVVPSGFLIGYYLDNWIWSGPDVDNLLLSLLFVVGAVLVLVGGVGALLRRRLHSG